ncbi:hypothetical protein [Mesorhizobium sp. CAU 1732]|uniref:hypothetical protein n=1 Tax=Mesorhizobium sp. CAU 1732 TaxID=3140358 RepID=UPI00325FFDD1
MAMAFVATLFAASPALGDDRPLIWEPTMPNENALGARVGTRLPTPWHSTAGVTLSVEDKGAKLGFKPMTMWGTVEMPSQSGRGRERKTRLQLSARGVEGTRTAIVSRSVKATLPSLDAEIDQSLAVDHDPRGPHQLRLRGTQSVRLTSPKTRTSVVASTSRSDTSPWKTAITVEQPVRKALKFSARVDGENWSSKKTRVGASYSFKW